VAEGLEVGGGMTERAVRVFLIADTSGSMSGSKIGTLNTAMREVIPVLRSAEDQNSRGTIEVRVLEFSSGSKWRTDRAINVQQYTWTDLVAAGTTDMGSAFHKLATALDESNMPRNAFQPVLILVSDGQPTDNYQAGLQNLNSKRWARASIRCAISVGRGTNETMLREFLGNPEFPLLQANNIEDLKNYIQWATVALSQTASQQVSGVREGTKTETSAQFPPPPPPTDSKGLPPNDVW
jgi:uncharacterized protein YegL